MMMQTATTNLPKNWPFRTYNGVQTEESRELETSKFKQSSDDLSDIEEGLF